MLRHYRNLEKEIRLGRRWRGYSGMGAVISAARMGCKVARSKIVGVLGGNGSSESAGLGQRKHSPR